MERRPGEGGLSAGQPAGVHRPFRRAVVQARETLNGGNDPQLADFVLDRAYFAEMAETARAVGSPFLEGYVRLLIDAANLRSAVRCARMGKGSDF